MNLTFFDDFGCFERTLVGFFVATARRLTTSVI